LNPKQNDLVVYTNSIEDRTINHFAVVVDPFTFESKWGNFEPIYQHRLFDVPEAYGKAAFFLTLKEECATEIGKHRCCNDIKYATMERDKHSPFLISV